METPTPECFPYNKQFSKGQKIGHKGTDTITLINGIEPETPATYPYDN